MILGPDIPNCRLMSRAAARFHNADFKNTKVCNLVGEMMCTKMEENDALAKFFDSMSIPENWKDPEKEKL